MIMEKVADKMVIRLADAKDLPRIKAIAYEAYAVYLDRMPVKPFPMLDDYARHIKHSHIYVLEHENAVWGYVVLMEKDADNLLLDNIAVHPECQGLGYGRLLARFAEDWGRRHGYKRICLYTNEVMTANVLWYQQLGYAVTHKTLENGYRRIYMAKALK